MDLFYKLLLVSILVVYSLNINANPLDDNVITCTEMTLYPETVFDGIDLGSGSTSPVEVNYSCPKSISEIDFMKELLKINSSIRSPDFSRICSGTMVYAQERYFSFDLAMLGYYPKGFTESEQKSTKAAFFKEWSYESLYNRNLYSRYIAELNRVRPLLAYWYVKNHSVNIEIANDYTTVVLNEISNHGFGGFSRSWEPEPLIPFTNEALEGNDVQFLGSISGASEIQKINSLKRLLIHQSSSLFQSVLDKVDLSYGEKGDESLISLALYRPEHVSLLLKSGFDVNKQNEFGKTPLFYAIQLNLHETVKVLLRNGANVNNSYSLQNENEWNCYDIKKWGRTPLMHAAQHSDSKMLAILLKGGADPQLTDKLGSTALDYAFKEQNIEFLKTFELNSKAP